MVSVVCKLMAMMYTDLSEALKIYVLFNGFLSISRNTGLYGVTEFLKTASIKFSVVHGEEKMVIGGAFGSLVIAFNTDLKSIDGFEFLVGVEGDLFFFQNPQLDHLVLEILMCVAGLTQIVENGVALKNVISTEPLPYSEPGVVVTTTSFLPLRLIIAALF